MKKNEFRIYLNGEMYYQNVLNETNNKNIVSIDMIKETVTLSDTQRNEEIYKFENNSKTLLEKLGFEETVKTVIKDKPILMQYTGLEDIVGYKIFEGDIIKTIDNEIGYIEYSEDEAGYIIVYGDIIESLNLDQVSYLEVIGTIYEKPELVENI